MRRATSRDLVFASLVLLSCAAAAPGEDLPTAPSSQISATATSKGQISGQVLSVDGFVLFGAQVTLRPSPAPAGASADLSLQASSDTSGNFVLSGVPSGTYELKVTLQGFSPATQQVLLMPGQVLALPPFHLTLQTVAINVTAITSEEAALEQVKTEEHQRLVGVLPNFFVSYTWTAQPLTAKQKYRLATHTVFDPGNLALAGLVAGVQHADNAFPGYGQGAAGYSKRFGADLANLVAGTYMGGAVLPSVFHQDPRYFYKGTGTKKARFFYAVSRAVITRGDNGHQQPNFSGILGDLSAGAISNLYYPASDRQGGTLFLENSILGIAGDALTDFVQEFVFSHFTLDTRTKKAAKP